MTHATRLSFLKVLAAMAWADGVVEEDERNRIKVLFNRFELEPHDRKELEVLLDHPVTFQRAIQFTKDFAGRLAPGGSRKQLVSELEAMVTAKEKPTPEEVELLEHARSILSSHTVVDGLVEKMRGLFGKTLFTERKKAGAEPGALMEYRRNSALRRLHELSRAKGAELRGDNREWNRITLLGVLLANVAHLGDGWHPGEREVVRRVLSEKLATTPPQQALLLEVIVEESGRDTDLQRICSEYCRVSTMRDRLEILDALFAVASADGTITKEEVERVRRIADYLWVSNPEYLSIFDNYRERLSGT